MAGLNRSFWSALRQGIRFWHTVRHLAVAQVATRLRVRLLRRWWRLIDRQATGGSPVGFARHGALCRPEARGDDAALQAARTVAARLGSDEFEFLRRSHRFDGGIAWDIPQQTQLWRFHLHYFSYVRELMLVDAAGGNTGYRQFRRLSAAWISGNTRIAGDGWHPYTLSLRIINWLKASYFWRAQGDQEADWGDHIGRSLRHQARFLEAQLEYDVRGNHLLENGRALVWLGLVAEDPAAAGWLRRGLSILEAELPEQVLPDGCHFERCPGYHFSILLSLTELCCLWELCGRERPAGLVAIVERMARFGRRILLPDGRYPRLKDTTEDQVPVAPTHVLAAAAHVLGPKRDPEQLRFILFLGEGRDRMGTTDVSGDDGKAGYLTAGRDGEFLVFDAGAPCPDYLPAHAHADALNYEFFAAGRSLVTDAGVYDYAPGAWRDYFRSTAAHNTVSVDGMNSSDVWGSFRVGRRARVSLLRRESNADGFLFEAEHDGFAHLPGAPRHRRTIIWRPSEWLAVVDLVLGEGVHSIENFVHIHPSLQPELAPAPPGDGWRIPLWPSPWTLISTSGISAELIRGCETPNLQGWYSAEFGRREPASVLRLSGTGSLPFASAYVLTTLADLRASLNPCLDGWELHVKGRENTWQYAVDSTDAPGLRRSGSI
jgi:uncharacterized heparinase superfamily protein